MQLADVSYLHAATRDATQTEVYSLYICLKLILLDTRSHLRWGTDCDILGAEQWVWLERQLSDPNPAQLTIIGSGIQVSMSH